MRAKVAIPLIVTAGVILSVMSMNALGIKHPADAAEPTAKPASGCPIYVDGFEGLPDDEKMGPYIQDWMNAHPVDGWPRYENMKTTVDTWATADLVMAQVFTPMGCEASRSVQAAVRLTLTDGWSEWYDAQPHESVDEKAFDYSGDPANGRCRMSFGTGGFHWSCSVSTS